MPRTVQREIPSFVYDPSCVLYLPLWKRDAHDGTSFISDDAHGYACSVTGATWGLHGRTFDGSDDNISLGTPAALNFGASSYTIWGWMKYSSSAADKPLFGSTDSSSRRRISLRSNAFSRQDPVVGLKEKAFTAISPNVFHFLTGIYDAVSGTVEPFVDTVSQGTTTGAGGTLADATDNLIGKNTNPAWIFAGIIGEVGAHNRVLLPQEIQRIHYETKWRYL